MKSGNAYEVELAALSGKHPGRNAVLVPLALKGLSAGRDPDTLVDEIIAAGGEPRLSEQEVRRAVQKALTIRGNNTTTTPFKPMRRFAHTKRPEPNEKRRGFVRWMIEEGGGEAHARDLIALSKPGNILANVLAPDKLYFFGSPLMKRTRDRLMTPVELAEKLLAGGEIPTHFIPNPLSGEAGRNENGEESYALDSLITERTLALIEFDALPLTKQAAFWKGVITKGMFCVASLVYSGGKSIHGLIRLKPDDWAGQWRDIEALLASDDDSAYRCDIACKNAGRMTRFPGAIRPETNKRQTLLYLG